MRIPLAWLQLTHEKRRFAAALAGISFAVVLMLAQLGFEDALLVTADIVQVHLNADLILLNPQYQYVLSSRRFTERRLLSAMGVKGVESVQAVYLAMAPLKNPVTRLDRDIQIIGFNPRYAALNLPGIAEGLDKIRDPAKILFDSIRRPEFGPIAETFQEKGTMTIEVARRQVEVAGLFQMGTSFAFDGTLVMSDEAFLRLVPFRDRGIIDLGLIRLKPGGDPEQAKKDITAILPNDVKVVTRPEFSQLEKDYWDSNTPIGFIFGMGVLMGVFVGCIIVYQILYSDVTDHLGEYATLKAMGYRDSFLFKVVIQEAVILSLLGFFPGVFISQLVYTVSRDATLLPLVMTLPRVIAVYCMTLVMCVISAGLAMRRLKAADPAEIF